MKNRQTVTLPVHQAQSEEGQDKPAVGSDHVALQSQEGLCSPRRWSRASPGHSPPPPCRAAAGLEETVCRSSGGTGVPGSGPGQADAPWCLPTDGSPWYDLGLCVVAGGALPLCTAEVCSHPDSGHVQRPGSSGDFHLEGEISRNNVCVLKL